MAVVLIFRFNKISGEDGPEECVVITENLDAAPEDHTPRGYKLAETHDGDIDNAHMLPQDVPLFTRD